MTFKALRGNALKFFYGRCTSPGARPDDLCGAAFSPDSAVSRAQAAAFLHRELAK